MSAQIIPFPTPTRTATPRERRTDEFVRLIRKACSMELSGVECPDDWEAYVNACLTRAESE